MKVSLVRIPTIIDAFASTAPICPPIGLAYLKRVVSAFAKEIQIIDSVGNFPKIRSIVSEGYSCKLIGQTKDEIIDLLWSDADIVLVSCMFSHDWKYACSILKGIRTKCSQALVIAGGEHITAVPEYSMKSSAEIDVCVLGGGESIIHDVLEAFLGNKQDLKTLPGTYIRNGASEIIKNIINTRIRRKDKIFWPDWEGFPLENYFSEGHGFGVNLGGRTMPIVASRGCPYQCTFCSSSRMWTTYWKSRDPQDVINEMKYYVEKYQITNFDFYDLTAIVQKKWIILFCKLLLKSGLKISWQLPSGTRSEAVDSEVARLLYQSGCRNMSFAPESGSLEILKLIKKKVNLPKMIQSMKSCVAEGVSIKVNIICGFPQERWKHLLETLKLIVQSGWAGCDDLSINQFSPYPGSELFESLQKTNKIKLDNQYFIGLSYYSSMTNAQSYSDYLSNFDILLYKAIGTSLFYGVSIMRRPWRIISIFTNVSKGKETTRLEKTLISFVNRFNN